MFKKKTTNAKQMYQVKYRLPGDYAWTSYPGTRGWRQYLSLKERLESAYPGIEVDCEEVTQ